MTTQDVKDKGNGKNPDPGKAFEEMRDMKIGDVKALFPEMQQGPLFSPNLDSGNPGVRLIANDDKLIDMLKIVYVENYEIADNVADALGECDEFLLNEDGKPNVEVLQRVEWIKYKLAIYCSVKGRFADAYKQTATGILTNAMSEKGWLPLQMPLGRNKPDPNDQNNQQKGRP